MAREIQARDILVVGASAGGVQAVGDVVAGLPPDLPAAVFVVVHSRLTRAPSPTCSGTARRCEHRTRSTARELPAAG
jgi:chemotaxis response regulator CheB